MSDFLADIAALGGVELPSATSTPDVQVNQSPAPEQTQTQPPSLPVVETLPVPIGQKFKVGEQELIVVDPSKTDVTQFESYNKAKSKWDKERAALLGQTTQLNQQLSMFQQMQLRGQQEAAEAEYQAQLKAARTPYEKAQIEVERRAKEVEAKEQSILAREAYEADVTRLGEWSQYYVEHDKVPPDVVLAMTQYAHQASGGDPAAVHQFREYAVREWLAGNRPSNFTANTAPQTNAPQVPQGPAPVPVVSPHGTAPGKNDPLAMFYNEDWDGLNRTLNRR